MNLLRRRPALLSIGLILGVTATVIVGYIAVNTHAATLVGDLNNDNVVNVFDLSVLLTNWGKAGVPADLNNSGSVDVFDLSILLSNWGQTGSTPTPTPTSTPTPTPGTVNLTDAHKKDIAMQLVSSAENSSLDWKAQYA